MSVCLTGVWEVWRKNSKISHCFPTKNQLILWQRPTYPDFSDYLFHIEKHFHLGCTHYLVFLIVGVSNIKTIRDDRAYLNSCLEAIIEHIAVIVLPESGRHVIWLVLGPCTTVTTSLGVAEDIKFTPPFVSMAEIRPCVFNSVRAFIISWLYE